MTIHETHITIHENLSNRRVRYNEKDFDVLVVTVTKNGASRQFAIKSENLPETDSIHLSYVDKNVTWAPKEISEYVVEITGLNL